MDSPRISVLMPVLNPHPRFFPAAVASVVAQTYPEWELIIVEAPGSTTVASLMSDFTDKRIRHICNSQRTSLVEQRNQAVSLARGDWIAMLDADDVAERERFARQIAYVDAHHEVDVLGSQLTIIDENDHPFATRRYPCDHREIVATMPRYNPLAHSAVLARKAVVVRAGGYHASVVEDYDLWSRLAIGGARFANLPEPLVRYRIQPQQLKSQRLRDSLRGTLDVKRKYWRNARSSSATLRRHLESLLLWLPPRVVMTLFQWTHFRRI